MTWLSIDGADNKKNGRACYCARWVCPEYAYKCNLPLDSLLSVFTWKLGDDHPADVGHDDLLRCVAVERTQADGRLGRGKTTPKVMVGLAWNTAAIAYTLARGAPVHEYTISAGGESEATDWIGGTNKAALHHRIWSALTLTERAVVASFGRAKLGPRKRGPTGSGRVGDVTNAIIYNNVCAATGRDLLKHDWYDALDAVGVGLFHLGRVGKGAAPIRRAATIGPSK